MIPSKKFTKTQAKQFVDTIDKMSDPAFDDLVAKWASNNVDDFSVEYEELRNQILSVYIDAKPRGWYETDLRVGLALYKEFNPENGFTFVMASDDDIWRYLSCKVFPDITYERYPTPEKEILEAGGRLNHKRFFSHTRRIWLKTLWWYVFLSWQGSEKKTYDTLKNCGTDTIGHLIERTGQGYRLNLYRRLMHDYSFVDDKKATLFKKIQKQNLVNCRTVEPALVKDAEKGYVENLFSQLSIERNNAN